jgi:hypothetical protein
MGKFLAFLPEIFVGKKVLRSKHTGVVFGYTERAARMKDYEVVELPDPKPKRKRRARPKAKAAVTPSEDSNGAVDQ